MYSGPSNMLKVPREIDSRKFVWLPYKQNLQIVSNDVG